MTLFTRHPPETDPWAELRARRDFKLSEGSRALTAMHRAHGADPEGRRCGDCAHLRKHFGDHRVKPFKCHAYGVTNGAATDWRLKWPGCGKFEVRGI